MNKPVNEEAKEFTNKLKKAGRDRSDMWAMWRGAVKLGKMVAEIITGASAAAVLGMAYVCASKAHTTVPTLIYWAMIFAVVLMAMVAAGVLGKYLKEKGRQ